VAFGTDRFPAFYLRDSGFDVDDCFDNERELATLLRSKWEIGLVGGVVIANPVPAEFEIEYRDVQKAIDTALEEASEMGITGKELTPWLLARIEVITGGRSLASNIRLVLNNAALAGRIAIELAALENVD
jgi:pseudouridine-5'-phosphate glycosidase